MQPVKLTIRGRFWDSQLYKGRLYLFDLDGALRDVDWNILVQNFSVPDRCRLALECAFQRSDYLYGEKWEKLFKDQEIRDLLRSKFDDLLKQNLTVDARKLDEIGGNKTNTPFPYAHNDSLVYKNQLYATSQSGVFTQPIEDSSIWPNKAEKLWDAPVSGLDISHDVLALAAGEEGLFRVPTAQHFKDWTSLQRGPQSVWKHLCNDCSYISSSILASGYDTDSGLVEFKSPKRDPKKTEDVILKEFWHSKSIGTVEGKKIFGESTRGGFVWGSKNRMCMAKNGILHVTQYATTNPRRKHVAKNIRSIQLDQWKGNAVSGDNAVFGAILELDNCLVIVRSDDNIETLPGEPTNWRAFPRSKYYTNQLHVIYDDRIEILSYNHDYFVNQKEKAFGEPQFEHFFPKVLRG